MWGSIIHVVYSKIANLIVSTGWTINFNTVLNTKYSLKQHFCIQWNWTAVLYYVAKWRFYVLFGIAGELKINIKITIHYMVIWLLPFCNNDCVDYEPRDNDTTAMPSNTAASCLLDSVLKVIKLSLFSCSNHTAIHDVCVYGTSFLYFFIPQSSIIQNFISNIIDTIIVNSCRDLDSNCCSWLSLVHLK